MRSLIAMVALALLVAACGTSEESGTTITPESSTTQTLEPTETTVPVQNGELVRLDVPRDNPVMTVTTVGAEVQLDLTRAASGSTTLTYGWEVSPAGPWLSATDGTGTPLAFYLYPVAP